MWRTLCPLVSSVLLQVFHDSNKLGFFLLAGSRSMTRVFRSEAKERRGKEKWKYHSMSGISNNLNYQNTVDLQCMSHTNETWPTFQCARSESSTLHGCTCNIISFSCCLALLRLDSDPRGGGGEQVSSKTWNLHVPNLSLHWSPVYINMCAPCTAIKTQTIWWLFSPFEGETVKLLNLERTDCARNWIGTCGVLL